MVVEVGVGNRDPVRGVADINKTIQVVLASIEIPREIAVVNPHIGGLVDSNGIAVVSIDLADLQVTHDNVADLTDVESDASNGCKRSARAYSIHSSNGTLTASRFTVDGLVRCNADLRAA